MKGPVSMLYPGGGGVQQRLEAIRFLPCLRKTNCSGRGGEGEGEAREEAESYQERTEMPRKGRVSVCLNRG